MGSGVAKAIRSAYPQAYLVDKEDYRSPIEKIGSYTCVKIGKLTIINLYCQYDFGYDGMRRFEYGAFKRALDEICRDFSFTGKSIGLPLLGSGLAAGDPDLIREILSWYATDGTWTIYHL
jgi:O-acetyl-ADP-ribose deacetylase (regulator of RNase III)